MVQFLYCEARKCRLYTRYTASDQNALAPCAVALLVHRLLEDLMLSTAVERQLESRLLDLLGVFEKNSDCHGSKRRPVTFWRVLLCMKCSTSRHLSEFSRTRAQYEEIILPDPQPIYPSSQIPYRRVDGRACSYTVLRKIPLGIPKIVMWRKWLQKSVSGMISPVTFLSSVYLTTCTW